MIFGNAGAQKTNDYLTPLGTVLNSFARVGNVSGDAGWFPRKGWLSFNYAYDRRRHGLPVEPDELISNHFMSVDTLMKLKAAYAN